MNVKRRLQHNPWDRVSLPWAINSMQITSRMGVQKTSCLSHSKYCFSSSWNWRPEVRVFCSTHTSRSTQERTLLPDISHHVYRELWALLNPHPGQNIISIFLNGNWNQGQWCESAGKGAHCQARQPEFHSQDPYGGKRKQIPTEYPMTFTYIPWHEYTHRKTHKEVNKM